MTELDKRKIHKGNGTVKYKNGEIGLIDEMSFMFTELGLEHKEKDLSCYGTCSGRITKTDLIQELNSPHPTLLDLDIRLENGMEIKLTEVEFIDDIPRTGIFEDVEFHCPWTE